MAKLDIPYDLPETFPQEVRDAYRTLWELHEADFQPGEDYRAKWDRESAAFDTIQEHAKTATEAKPVGVILSFGVADGSANYLVIETKPLTLTYLPVVDAYQIPVAHVRGINLTDVKQGIKRAKTLNELFGSRKVGRVN